MFNPLRLRKQLDSFYELVRIADNEQILDDVRIEAFNRASDIAIQLGRMLTDVMLSIYSITLEGDNKDET